MWRLLVVLALVGTAPVKADPPAAVALASSDPGFAAALTAALSPTGTTVVPAQAEPPELGALAAGSRAVADRMHAGATVWLIGSPSGATLVAYDRAVDRVLVRELPYTLPLQPPQAAEAARMTRTMLRALAAMPEAERTQPTPAAAPSVEVAAPAVTPAQPWLAVGLAAAVHVSSPGADAAPAGSLAVIYRPRALGASLSAAFEPSVSLSSPGFSGRARDTVIAGAARQVMPIAPNIAVAGEAGLALHVVELGGTLDGMRLDSTRHDPAIRLGASAGYAVRRDIEVGVAVSADTLLERQVYSSGSTHILEITRVQVVTGIGIAVQIR